jgi:hypothetical protein
MEKNNHLYISFKWDDAQTFCKKLNSASSLPIIENLEEATFLQQYAYDLVKKLH